MVFMATITPRNYVAIDVFGGDFGLVKATSDEVARDELYLINPAGEIHHRFTYDPARKLDIAYAPGSQRKWSFCRGQVHVAARK